jgi:hypothetical protein
MRPSSLKQVQATMRLLEARLQSLINAQVRKGLVQSYGTFATPAPNVTPGRAPNPFAGGN